MCRHAQYWGEMEEKNLSIKQDGMIHKTGVTQSKTFQNRAEAYNIF